MHRVLFGIAALVGVVVSAGVSAAGVPAVCTPPGPAPIVHPPQPPAPPTNAGADVCPVKGGWSTDPACANSPWGVYHRAYNDWLKQEATAAYQAQRWAGEAQAYACCVRTPNWLDRTQIETMSAPLCPMPKPG